MAVAPASATAKSGLSAARETLAHAASNSAVLPLSLILIVGVSLRVYHLSYLSLWPDEAFSRYYYKTGLEFMWTDGLHWESSPPLYYMALGAWIHFFGASEASLRSLSAAASSLAIVLVYGLGSELFDRKHGLVAAALFALSATEIYYAQEARPYALLLIPVLLMLSACARYLRGPEDRSRLAIYVIAATASIYTHTTMLLLVASCGLAVLGYLCASRRRLRNQHVLAWLAANLCVGVLALPVTFGMADPEQLNQLSWIPPVDLHSIGAVISNTIAGTLTPGRFPGAVGAMLVIGVLALSIRRAFPAGCAAIVALAIPGFYATLVMLVSVAVQPILLSRIFCWVGIPLCLVEARALLAPGWLRPIAIAVIGGTTAIGLSYLVSIGPNAKEPWREAVQAARTELKQADLVVLGPDTDPAAFMYYAPTLTHVVMWTTEPKSASELGIMPGLFGIPGVTLEEVARRITAASRAVLVARASDQAVLPRLLAYVSAPASRAEYRCVGGDGQPTDYPCGITVFVWRPSSPTREQRVAPDATTLSAGRPRAGN